VTSFTRTIGTSEWQEMWLSSYFPLAVEAAFPYRLSGLPPQAFAPMAVSSTVTSLEPENPGSVVVLVSFRVLGPELCSKVVGEVKDGEGALTSLRVPWEKDVMVDCCTLGCLWSPAKKTSGASLANRGLSEGMDKQMILMLHSRMLHIKGSARSSRGRHK
jgi:hypothetical protein